MTDSKVKDEHYSLLFEVRRSIRYHSYRQQHYERWHKITMFCAVLFNTLSFASFILEVSSGWPIWVKSLPYVIASILMVVDILVELSRRAGDHADFIRQFTDLQRQLQAEMDGPTEKTIREVSDTMLTIEAKEPPVLHVLNALCYNEVSRLLGSDKDYYISVHPIQRLCANFRDIWRHRLHLASTSHPT